MYFAKYFLPTFISHFWLLAAKWYFVTWKEQ